MGRCRRFAIVALLVGLVWAPGTGHAWRAGSDPAAVWRDAEIRYSIVGRPPAGVSEADWWNAAAKAAETWIAELCAPRLGSTTSTDMPASGDGVVSIQVIGASQWASRGLAADAAATTDILYEETETGWVIVDAEILVNGSLRWADEEAYDLEAAIAHEWGHVLGLGHCCSHDGSEEAPRCDAESVCPDAIMYPVHLGISQRDLSEDDRAGLCALYPSGACSEPGCVECSTDGDCWGAMVCSSGRCEEVSTEPECQEDADCPFGVCSTDRCILGSLGDPCLEAAECSAGVCAAGTCSERCDALTPCPEGFECAGAGECVPLVGTLGSACASPSECLSQVCVDGSQSAPVCSRHCSALEPCPAGWTCGMASGERVCVPRSATSGCAAGGRPPRSGVPYFAVVFVMAWLVRPAGGRRRRSAGCDAETQPSASRRVRGAGARERSGGPDSGLLEGRES